MSLSNESRLSLLNQVESMRIEKELEKERKIRVKHINKIIDTVSMAKRSDTHLTFHYKTGFLGVELSDDKKTFKKAVLSPIATNSEEGVEYWLDHKANPLHGSFHGAYLDDDDCKHGAHQHAMYKTLIAMSKEAIDRHTD